MRAMVAGLVSGGILGDSDGRTPELLAGRLRFALWLAAYVVLGLLLAIFVQSLSSWLLS